MQFAELLEKSKEEMLENLQKCIRIPSVYADDESGYPYGQQLHDCLTQVLELAESMGFETYNMDEQLGWCEYGTGEEMVVVLGHLDVVPEGDGWSVPPYEGVSKDGKIYGRGAMDDKGPAMAALYALKAIKDAGVSLKRRVRIIFGLNEETGAADMRYYKAHGGELPVMGFTPDADYPVIHGEKGIINATFACKYEQQGELRLKEIWGGTALNIVSPLAWATFACSKEMAEEIAAEIAEKISCELTEDGVKIIADGVSAHGGSPWEGENANGRLLQFLSTLPIEGELKKAINFLAEKIGMEYDGKSLGISLSDEESGALTLNFGVLRGNAESIEVKFNYRYPVTKEYDDCAPILQKEMIEAGFEQTFELHKRKLYVSRDSELVKRLMKVYKDCSGRDDEPTCIGGGTYAKALPNVVAFGPVFPGEEITEHKPDEYIIIDSLMDTANIIAEAMCALATD